MPADTADHFRMNHSLPYLANCSFLFTETPLLARPAAARAAGFDAIELAWPFPTPVPTDRDVDTLVEAIEASGVTLVGLNFFAGDLTGPDAGVLSIPNRASEFVANIDIVIGIGERLGAKVFNALYGNRVEGVIPGHQDELATQNLAKAATAAAGIGATVLIEPLSGPKPYPVRTVADAVAVVDRVHAAGSTNVGVLADLYHLESNGDDIGSAVDRYADHLAHVQIADAPGRHEPGTGSLKLANYLGQLQEAGYYGWISLEYNPSATTEESLAWLPASRRRRHHPRSIDGPRSGHE